VVPVVDRGATNPPSIKTITKEDIIPRNAHYEAVEASGYCLYHARTTNFEKTLIPQYSLVHLNA
jgi:hypothetical protein